MTALIHDEHLNLWNITADDLSLLSEQNTGTLLPAGLNQSRDAIMELGEGDEGTLTDASSLFLSISMS